MKNCNEMVESLLERRDRYEAEQQKKRKTLTRTLTPLCSFCLVALVGFGIWQGGLTKQPPIQTADDAVVPGIKDWYGPGESEPVRDPGEGAPIRGGNVNLPQGTEDNMEETQIATIVDDPDAPASTQASNDFCDKLGMIVYENKTYVQISTIAEDAVELGEHIGKGEDFEGYYKNEGVGAEIYTVKDSSDLLAVVLENGGLVILQKTVD